MFSKLWFRFGIPLGSATVLTALLDFAFSSYWFLNDFGSYLYFHVWDHEEPTDYRTVLGLVGVSSRILLTFCLWIFILLGQRAILIFWIPLSVITDLLLLGHGINNTTHDGFISDEIWFLNIAVVILLRCYLTSVIYQAFYRLLQNARAEELLITYQQELKLEELTDQPELSIVPTTTTTTTANGSSIQNNNANGSTVKAIKIPINHLGNQHRKSIPEKATSSSASPRYLLIEPIGESPSKILEFYNDTPRLGAAVLVIFELIWNIFTLSTHSLTEFLLGGRIFFMIKEEETIMRIWRIIVGLTALVFIFKRKKTLLRFWLIAYFWTLFSSLCIFVYVMADWLDPPAIVILVVITIWFGDNIVRFAILYFCLRVTTMPPKQPTADSRGNAEVGRSHSLRSQSRPRSRKSKAKKARFDSLHRQEAIDQTSIC